MAMKYYERKGMRELSGTVSRRQFNGIIKEHGLKKC